MLSIFIYAGKVFSVMGSVETIMLLMRSLLWNRAVWPLAISPEVNYPPLPYLMAAFILIVPTFLLRLNFQSLFLAKNY